MRAGHSQGTITERYIHAAQVALPGAAARGEARIFAAAVPSSVPHAVAAESPGDEKDPLSGTFGELPGLDSNPPANQVFFVVRDRTGDRTARARPSHMSSSA